MKFKQFLGVGRTTQQAYFKEGVELLYPDQKKAMHIAILPAYDFLDPKPTSWAPAVNGDEESDFYTTVRAAKFVGHGNRRAKTSFLSPKTFDINADDPYEAFYDYCSRSDRWSYLTKDKRGRALSGEVEGAIFPRMKNFFVANVVDYDAGPRNGVYVTELSESVAKSILYSMKKNGKRVDGIAFERDDAGNLVFGDITNPKDALVIEVACGNKGYIARPAVYANGSYAHMEIPETLLQHRQHMEEPGSFLVHPGDGQAIVDRLAGMLRGYISEDGHDEIEALKEAMVFAYGEGKYEVDDGAVEEPETIVVSDTAAKAVVEAPQEQKVEVVSEAIRRGVVHEKYTPPEKPPEPKSRKRSKIKPVEAETKAKPVVVDDAPGEDIDPSDIANVRAMLLGGK